ncbi:Chromatin modification- protein meaf6 [Entomophthora muscae]|uniref:Chromatin modification- protein meaf6 n=1 Tax=Entomophthora muscae TaxID=34485 RepID=A0ACC2UH03_9FUNG|nr:Chromatin modification- protein meaf6 [Entomophthora muscae]
MSRELSPSKRESLISDILQDEAELQKLLAKKDDLVNTLQELDAKIYRLETNYLDDTRLTGNVVKGFDQYMVEPSATTNNPNQHGLKRPMPIEPSERIFSNSSARPFDGIDRKHERMSNALYDRSTPTRIRDLSMRDKERSSNSHNKFSRNRANPERSSPVVIRLPNPRISQQETANSETLSPPRIRITLRTSPQRSHQPSRDANEDELDV